MTISKDISSESENTSSLPSLSDFFAKHHITNRREIVHLGIDIQEYFCAMGYYDRDKTAIARHIAYNIAPDFNRLGIPTWWVYFRELNGRNDGPWKDYGGLVYVEPQKGDRYIGKTHKSAFQGSDIDYELRHDNRRVLIASGFKLMACVRETIIEAAEEKDYPVILLSDGTNGFLDDKTNDKVKQYFSKAGILTTTSARLMHALQKLPA